ncbi:hypothetical protein N566_15560 [Streptomycetaceae bacterium MP113-05]|nr:hypothetical protein N566_15560 [Streptomycetaceae bacterium MP113-05]
MSDVQGDGTSSDAGKDADREKFREALERKKGLTHAREAHEQGRTKVKGMTGPVAQKRQYRRKTG